MKRWHQDLAISRREWRKHRRSHVESNKNRSGYRLGQDPYEVDCPCDDQLGRFRKKDAFDCGQVLCRVCHYNKWLNDGGHELTRQEILFDISFREQLQELK